MVNITVPVHYNIAKNHLSCEGFAGNDEEHSFRVEFLQRFRHVGPVNI
jgi:hypothetical protein